MAPHLNEFKGACSERGRYKLELLTESYPTAREMRNIIKMLELTALWLEDDETQQTSLLGLTPERVREIAEMDPGPSVEIGLSHQEET